MRRTIAVFALCLIVCFSSGCAMFPAEKHMVIEGRNISTPYGKGDQIKISRDVYYGSEKKKQPVTPTIDEEALKK